MQAESSLKSSFIQTDRMRFHLLSQGSDDGLPILFLHGSYGSANWWLPVLSLLPPEIQVVAPDMRGCGQSDKSEDGYGIAEQAEDITQLVSALGWDDFDLVGHSTGGAVAIEFALQHMERLHSLTLVDSVPIEGVKTPLETLQILSKMREDRELLTEAIMSLLPAYFPIDEGDNQKQEYFNLLVEDAANQAPAAFTEVAQAISEWNRFADAHRLTLPTSIIWGELDQIVDRESITRTLLSIPGANNLEVLRGVGHSPIIEAPLTFTELLVEFITEDFAGYDEVRDEASSSDVVDDEEETADAVDDGEDDA